MKQNRAAFKNTDKRSLKRSMRVSAVVVQAKQKALKRKKKTEARAVRKAQEAERKKQAELLAAQEKPVAP